MQLVKKAPEKLEYGNAPAYWVAAQWCCPVYAFMFPLNYVFSQNLSEYLSDVTKNCI